MGDNQNWNNVGDQIKDALQDALDTGDFKNLNSVVAGTVNSALTEAKRQMKIAAGSMKDTGWNGGAGSFRTGQGAPGNGSYTGSQGAPGSGSYTGGQGAPGSGSYTGSQGAPGNNGWTSGQGGPGSGGFTSGKGMPGGNRSWNAAGGNGNFNTGRNGQTSGNWNTAGNRGSFSAWNRGGYGNWSYNKPRDTFHYRKAAPAGVYTSFTQKQSVPYPPKNSPNKMLPAVRTRKVGRISGTLYMVFGSIGTGIMGCALAILIILFFAMQAFPILPIVIVGILLLGFVTMLERGCVKKERLKRAERYIELCDGKTYINIEDLAMHLSRSRRTVLKDVKKMLKLGIFPEGHLDEKETCLMLDDATYREYLKLQKERRVQEMEDKMARMRENQKKGVSKQQEENQEAAFSESDGEAAGENAELEALIADGTAYIRKLRDYNDSIEGEAISSKLFQLEDLLKEIFDRVREHPEQMPQMHKFMDYYLPTTLKLVQAYEEFDSVSIPGEDIISAKDEIEKTLDTINSAFTELLNNLYRDTVFDVTTDAQVLQTMLAREGLMKELELEKVPR